LKRGLSLILLIVFLFNVGGYYIVFLGLHFQLDQELTSRLDNGSYDVEETVHLKIPMSLPYPIHSGGFERVDGRFEHNGEYFRLIKHKWNNDTLYIVCIRDHGTRELVSTMISYVQHTLGLENSGRDQKALNYLSKLIKDFFPQQDIKLLHQNGFSMRLDLGEKPESFSQPEIPVHAPPPRI
jgi:hypothetical protein